MIEELETEDLRIESMSEMCLRSLKLRPEKWIKMYEYTENRKRIDDFLEKTEHDTLVFYIHPTNGNLLCSYSFPAHYRSKAFYLTKKNITDTITKVADLKSYVDFGGIIGIVLFQTNKFLFFKSFLFLSRHLYNAS